jgi:tetratricopeptide (TPR) repeat protein
VPFWRRKPYDRAATLEAAHAARARGRIRKAISGYAKVLEHDPHDWPVHAHLAPLLARRRKWNESRASFNTAAEGFLEQGFSDKAIAVWTLAAQTFPEDVEYRERIANELAQRGRRADAVRSLLDGRTRLRSRRQRPIAILLLRQALVLQPLHFEATLDLAKLLGREKGRKEAQKLLRDLRVHTSGPNVRRLRAAQFWISPSPRFAMDWMLAR